MKSMKSKIIGLTMFCGVSTAFPIPMDTDYHLVGTIISGNNGSLEVRTMGDPGWHIDDCGSVEPISIFISDTVPAKDQWLSLLMLAKTSGMKVRFDVDVSAYSCPNPVYATKLYLE